MNGQTLFAVHDWGELIASVSTHIVFAFLIFEIWLIPHMTLRTARHVLMILLIGAALMYGFVATMDTTVYHLPPDWPDWPYWRRVLWRPWNVGVHGTALLYAFKHRRAWKREPWYVVQKEDAPAA